MSHSSLLDQMRDRLVSLSGEARSIRSQVPREYEPDVERIEQQMQRLGERLTDLGRGALVPYNPAQRMYEHRVKEVRYVTEDDVRVGRAEPNQVIALSGPGGWRRAGEEQQGANPWDEAAASALVALYESGDAYAASQGRRHEQAASSARAGVQATGNRAVQRPLYAGGSSAARMGGSQQSAPYGCAVESGLLDQRFAEIAARIEQSLAQIRPEAALASLSHRFDQLETQLNAVLGQVATRADLEELSAAQAQIEEISVQIAQFRRQMMRLDMIDAHLGTLTEQLSDERLTRVFNDGVHVGADVGRLDAIDAQLRMVAVQLSDERLSGLVSRSAARSADYEDVANAAAQRVVASMGGGQGRDAQAREIGEVRGMLESLINERRHSDENYASILETMQNSIFRVLDRIDALELSQQQAQPALATRLAAVSPRPAPAPAPAPTYTAPAATPAAYDDLIPPTATVYAEMPGAHAGEASDFLPSIDAEEAAAADLQSYHQDTAAEHAPPRVPVYTSTGFSLDDAFSRSRDIEAESFGEAPAPKRSLDVMRHDFIADAHRAKLKAASKPEPSGLDADLRAGELSVEPSPAKPRRRSIFSFRSQRAAMTLLVLLAAIPAAIFFLPRTTAERVDDLRVPATVAPAPTPKRTGTLPSLDSMDAAPMAPAAPNAVPPAIRPQPKQSLQDLPSLGQQGDGKLEDASSHDGAINTGSLPDGITMQPGAATGAQLAQLNDQAHMAYLSGQLGIAAAKATPASLMEEHLLRGAAEPESADASVAGGAPKLPPATVGPYSLRLAAAQGDASAQFEVASRLAEGKGTDQDLAEAAQWYQRAAASGFPMAQFRLGTLYERGLGVKADPQRAAVWYERAAKQGNVKAMHNLAVLTASRAPKADFETAARWFNAAAEHGLADSQYNLAVLYENGMGVGKNLPQAYKWLVLAANAGDKDAAGRRDALKAKLSSSEIAAVEAELDAWHAKPITGMANDARLAGQSWRDGSRQG